MDRPCCLLLMAMALMGCSLRPLSAGDEVVFHTDVSLVRVDAQVVDHDNRAITGLRAGDFILIEQGRHQEIRNFASEDMPVDVVFLLDVSASMRPHVERIASAAHEALRVLKDQDRMAIMVFDRSTRLRLPFRNSRADVEREFERLLDQETFHGGTDITRGLLDATDYVAREGRRDARRAIVILTDDQTERNRDVEGVSRELTKADAVLSAVLAPDAMGTGGRRGGGGTWPSGGSPGTGPLGGPLGGIILGRRGTNGGRGPGSGGRSAHTQSAGTAEIARRSGGDSMPVDDAYALETTLARIRQRYALYFNLPEGAKSGEQRGIEVDLADSVLRRYSGADVRYRRVYFVPSGPVEAARTGAEPTVVARAPVNASGGSAEPSTAAAGPTLRRRPAVDANSSPDGPLTGSASPNASEARSSEPAPPPRTASRPVDERSGQSGPMVTDKTDQKKPCGGWHRADEPTPPPCPSDTPEARPRPN